MLKMFCILFSVFFSYHAQAEIEADELKGLYDLKAPLQLDVVRNQVEIFDSTKYRLTESGTTYDLICEGDYIIVNEVFIGHVRCQNGILFTHIMDLTGLTIKNLDDGVNTTVYASHWGFSNPLQFFITRVK